MLGPTKLRIRLVDGIGQYEPNAVSINSYFGGPSCLLLWLEEQLGIVPAPLSDAERTATYIQALNSLSHDCLKNSLANDLWATANELLNRREELLLGGWDYRKHQIDLPLLDALVEAESKTDSLHTNADRIGQVIKKLNDGATLPDHICELQDAIEIWPPLWQSVFKHLKTSTFPEAKALATPRCTLRAIQSDLLPLDGAAVTSVSTLDDSLHWVEARSEASVIDIISSVLSQSEAALSQTVIYCENEVLASGLDSRLAVLGLPTMGATISQTADPIGQILPLALSIVRTPVDPQLLLEFLNLPVSPIPAHAARRFAKALTEMPGIDNREWKKAFDELQETDDSNKVSKRVEEWIYEHQMAVDDSFPTEVIAAICRRVSQWSMGRAHFTQDQSDDQLLAKSLRRLSSQASITAELVELLGNTIEQPQLDRLLMDVLGAGSGYTPHQKQEGSPCIVRSLGEIQAPFERLIWIGAGTQDSPKSKWPSRHRTQLRKGDVWCDDGSNRLSSQRTAEAAGFGRITESVLVIGVPQDEELRTHPICQSIREYIQNHIEQDWCPIPLEDLVIKGDDETLKPFQFSLDEHVVNHGQPERLQWKIPSGLLQEREKSSATELETKLACPLKWTLNYSAKIRGSNISALPTGVRLFGTYMHSVLESVFNSSNGKAVQDVDEAVEIVQRDFMDRLPAEAATLAQAASYSQADELKKQLGHATRILFEVIRDGGYEIVGMEFDIDSEVLGRPLTGSIDCLLKQSQGKRAIIDFKFGSDRKYQSYIENGTAVQLATYAATQAPDGTAFPSVAYLTLSNGRLFTPSADPVSGAKNSQVVDGPAIKEVWDEFTVALQNANDWLDGNQHVPARPALDVDDWPSGVELVLESDLKTGEVQSVCKYCDYGHFCGIGHYA